MENNHICQVCNEEQRLVPAGVSKAGKSYDAFRGCKNYCKPVKAQFKTSPQAPQGQGDGFQVIGESLARIELKIDVLLDNAGLSKIAEVKESEIPVINEELQRSSEENLTPISEIPF